MIEISQELMALIGLAMFATPIAILGIWAGNRAEEHRKERIRASDEALYREVYGPAGKPKQDLNAEQEPR